MATVPPPASSTPLEAGPVATTAGTPSAAGEETAAGGDERHKAEHPNQGGSMTTSSVMPSEAKRSDEEQSSANDEDVARAIVTGDIVQEGERGEASITNDGDGVPPAETTQNIGNGLSSMNDATDTPSNSCTPLTSQQQRQQQQQTSTNEGEERPTNGGKQSSTTAVQQTTRQLPQKSPRNKKHTEGTASGMKGSTTVTMKELGGMEAAEEFKQIATSLAEIAALLSNNRVVANEEERDNSAINNNGSSSRRRHEDTQSIQRLEQINQQIQALHRVQMYTGRVNGDCILPKLVNEEIEYLQVLLDVKGIDLNVGQSSGDGGRGNDDILDGGEGKLERASLKWKLERAKSLLGKVRQMAGVVCEKLAREGGGDGEEKSEKNEGAAAAVSSALEDGGQESYSIGGDGDQSNAGQSSTTYDDDDNNNADPPHKKKASKGLSVLSKVRKSYERQNSQNLEGCSEPFASFTKLQFLAEQTGETKDLEQRVTITGDISEIAARVTGSVPLNGMRQSFEYGSNSAFLTEFPSMAPPMQFARPLRDANFSSFTSGQGKKKGKKRRRDMYSVDGNERSKKKKERGRSRKDGDDIGRDRADTSMSFDSSDGDVAMATVATRQYTEVRMLPDPTPRYKDHVIATDDFPQRVSNPLLSLPRFPTGVNPPPDDIPMAGELWNIADIHFADPDTYPISFLAQALGFDVPEEAREQPFAEEFDAMRVPVRKLESDLSAQIPDAGSFVDKVWKDGGDPRSNAEKDDALLSYCDPLWMNILSAYRGYNDDDFKDAGRGFQSYSSPFVLGFAQERGIIDKDPQLKFRFATMDDEQTLHGLEEKVRSGFSFETCSYNSCSQSYTTFISSRCSANGKVTNTTLPIVFETKATFASLPNQLQVFQSLTCSTGFVGTKLRRRSQGRMK